MGDEFFALSFLPPLLLSACPLNLDLLTLPNLLLAKLFPADPWADTGRGASAVTKSSEGEVSRLWQFGLNSVKTDDEDSSSSSMAGPVTLAVWEARFASPITSRIFAGDKTWQSLSSPVVSRNDVRMDSPAEQHVLGSSISSAALWTSAEATLESWWATGSEQEEFPDAFRLNGFFGTFALHDWLASLLDPWAENFSLGNTALSASVGSLLVRSETEQSISELICTAKQIKQRVQVRA